MRSPTLADRLKRRHPMGMNRRNIRLWVLIDTSALAEELQRAHPGLPLVGTGYSYLQEFLPQAGAANLRDGRISFVGLGRASLSQPDMPRLLRETGSLDRKRVCRTFSYCTAMMRAKDHPMGQFPAGCPPFDKEAYNAIWKEVQQLQVRTE